MEVKKEEINNLVVEALSFLQSPSSSQYHTSSLRELCPKAFPPIGTFFQKP